MAKPPKDTRPRHQQIAAELRALIMSGDIPPGSQLPTTAQLMERFAAQNQTIQNALNLLKAEGFAEGWPGKGVYVRTASQQPIEPADYATTPAPGQPYPWITEAERRSQRGASQLLNVSEVPAPAEVAHAFGVELGSPVVRRAQLLTLDDEPVELVHNYYPVDLARGTGLAEQRKIRGGSPALLADMGAAPTAFADELSIRPPTVEEFVALELPTEVPVLRTFRVAYAGNRPVEASVLVKAGHRYKLRYRWPAQA